METGANENRRVKQMGAGQSVTLDTATEDLKNRVGIFSLRGTQKQFLEGLSVFLRLVLSQNTLYDLEPILTNPEKCHEFYIVLSSVLKNEFRVLRLPDATTRGATHKVPWMTKKQYKQLESEPLRKNVCNDIAWFVLRYTSLVVALTASVKINGDMPALLERSAFVQGTVTKNKTIRDLVLSPQIEKAIQYNNPIPPQVLNELISGSLKHIKLTGTETFDARPLFAFDGQERIVMNVEHGYIYSPMKSSSGLLSIELSSVVRPTAPLMQRYGYGQPYPIAAPGYGAAPLPAPAAPALAPPAPALAPPAPAPPVPAPPAPAPPALAPPGLRPAPGQPQRLPLLGRANNNISIDQRTTTTETGASGLSGGRKSRKHRLNRRSTRKQRGGDNDIWYSVRLRDLATCDHAPCQEIASFYLNTKGLTVSAEEYSKIGSGAVVGMPFADRIDSIINRDSIVKVATVAPAETGPANPDTFLPLNKIDASTYNNLKSIQKALETKSEGTSPAQYRAFLLASRIEKGSAGQPDILHNLFCGDSWASRRTTDMVSYALLNALYSDRQDGGKESATADELRRTVGDFTGSKVLVDYVKIGAYVEGFENTKFPAIPAELDPYCKQISTSANFRNSGDRGVVSADDKEILLDAHRQLRELYDTHLQEVVDILKRIVIPKKTTYGQEPELLLTPEFESDERGALVLLEEIIKDARMKLATHFLAVEKTYYGALQKLRERAQGRYVSAKKA